MEDWFYFEGNQGYNFGDVESEMILKYPNRDVSILGPGFQRKMTIWEASKYMSIKWAFQEWECRREKLGQAPEKYLDLGS